MEVSRPSRRAFLRGRLTPHPIALIGGGCFAQAGIVCQSCGDVCPERAIRFHPRIGLPPQPVLNATACTGCGECVTACPASAIAIDVTETLS